MAGSPRSIDVKVNLEVPTEAVERLAAAQERFNAALRDLQLAISEVQMATYGLAESVGSIQEETSPPEPEKPETPAPADPPTPQEN